MAPPPKTTAYSAIYLIYNPNSTGPSQRLAKQVQRELQSALPKQRITLAATAHAGHAEMLAYEAAMASHHPLIISASGDGGYHEVVNGILRASRRGSQAVAGLLPAGNANDHYRSLHETDFVKAVVGQHERRIDVLTLDAVCDGTAYHRYAHSYIGVGLTPRVGRALSATQLNRFKEIWVVGKSLAGFRFTRLKVKGTVRAYHSLVFSNVARMAKFLTLNHTAQIDDGQFEVNALYRHHKLRLLLSLVKASLHGLYAAEQTNHYRFQTVARTLVQLDGEVITVDAHSEVRIGIERRALRCIV